MAETEQLVQETIRLLAKGMEIHELQEALIERVGCAAAEAADAINFTPIAFAKILCEAISMEFPATYVMQTDEGVSHGRFADNEIFQVALSKARAMKAESRSEFLAIAAHSAEYGCVDKALRGGMTLEELAKATIAPPVIWRP